MHGITAFLQKFAHLTPPERSIKRTVSEALRDVCDISLPESAIRVRGSAVTINTSSVIKSEIHLHRREILATISRKAPLGVRVSDLR